MYKHGELQTAPVGCPSECVEHDHPIDMRGEDDGISIGGAFLPHSCEEWVIGGPEQIRMLIRDLEEALVTLTLTRTEKVRTS